MNRASITDIIHGGWQNEDAHICTRMRGCQHSFAVPLWPARTFWHLSAHTFLDDAAVPVQFMGHKGARGTYSCTVFFSANASINPASETPKSFQHLHGARLQDTGRGIATATFRCRDPLLNLFPRKKCTNFLFL